MTTIITGSFQRQDDARQARSDLLSAGFASGHMATFFVNPPGQHDLYAIGGDVDESPGTEDAATGAALGAAYGGAIGVAVGIAAAPVLGPAAPLASAGVGAYAGSLYGALGNTDNRNNPEAQRAREEVQHSEPSRKSGMLVAVSAPASTQQDTAIRILRARGATDIERTEGTIVAGEWKDFNPLMPPRLVAG